MKFEQGDGMLEHRQTIFTGIVCLTKLVLVDDGSYRMDVDEVQVHKLISEGFLWEVWLLSNSGDALIYRTIA